MRRAPPNRFSSAGIALAALLLGPPAFGRSQLLDPVALRDQLLAAEREHAAELEARRTAAERARAAALEEQRLAEQRVAAAERLRAADVAVADAAEHIADLARRREEAEARLHIRAADLAPLLPLIERLSLYPTETLLALPETPEDALRGAIVLKGLAGTLEHEAQTLRAQQADIARLSDEIAAQMPALQEAQAAQAVQAAELDDQISAARATGRTAEDEAAAIAQKAAAAAAQAVTLRGALSELEAQQQAALAAAKEAAARASRERQQAAVDQAQRQQVALTRPAGPGLSQAVGAAPRLTGAPVAGRLLHAFGDSTAAGAAQGVSYEAAPSARVTAPCAGRAVFAGPFRSFGLLLILDCGGGYHFVLAGLERLDVEVGHPVQANEPVGVMPGWDPRSTAPRPALYVELRRGAQPIDPGPWLRGRSS
jgi:septal ring factor EnvC (AmiA/AmiB activator)